jgi:hypothetical protein
MPEEDAYQPNMWLHPFLHVCQIVCCLFFLHVCQILCFTIHSNLVQPVFVFCFFCFLLMKLSPNIRQSPPPKWSDSLYYYEGRKISKNDWRTSSVYWARTQEACRQHFELKAKFEANQTIKLKTKWQAAWESLTPYQRRIIRMNIWTWPNVTRTSFRNSLHY